MLLSETEGANKSHDFLRTAVDYKRYWDEELERRRRLGVNLPDPIPRPDDIIIDVKTGQVKITGPMTKEDKVEWDRLYARVEECDRTIEELVAREEFRSV